MTNNNDNELLTVGLLAGALIGGAVGGLVRGKQPKTVGEKLLAAGENLTEQARERAGEIDDYLQASTKQARKQLKKEQKQLLKTT